jgi:serine phosphatase RsbU (regulator of sigma subunit)/pSer/pThr/pTyr-binding forkhead associated (FHA) protein
MTSLPRLNISDLQGSRVVVVDKPVFLIGRRAGTDLQVAGRDVSRDHARIELKGGVYHIVDCGSRFGTFVNGQAVTVERPLAHGDRVRLGQTEAVELVFLVEDPNMTMFRSSEASVPDLVQMSAILNGLRAVGSGRVLEEVLTIVLDSALEVTSAERGLVMLAAERPGVGAAVEAPASSGELEFKIGREKGRRTLAGTSFATSDKIPREVFQTGRSRIVGDLMDGSLADAHGGTIAIGIRHVLCVPLQVSAYGVSPGEARGGLRTIGVLYLDGRERGTMLSSSTRASLEAFATQAALAIDSARLYAEAAEKAKLDRDLRIAAEIQRALLPEPRYAGATFDVAGATIPCRTIGGDFFDYLELADGEFGFTLGDVAGKGPPAALLAATVQSNFAAHAPIAADPADLMGRINRALLRRAIEARFATMCYGVLSADGRLSYSNAGQEPPVVVRAGGVVESLDVGGPVLGLLGIASYEHGDVRLAAGDLVVIFSDGVTEARDSGNDEYGRKRLLDVLTTAHGRPAEDVLHEVLRAVHAFAGAAPQADDITVLVLRYRGN